MRPISVFNYYKKHKLRVLMIVLIIAFSITVVALLNIFLASLQLFYKKSYLSPNEVFSLAYHPYDKVIIPPPPMGDVEPLPIAEDVFLVYSILGKVNGRVFNVNADKVSLMTETAGMRLAAGMLPAVPGEIAIPAQWAENQNVAVGDIVDLTFGATSGVRVVGLLNAPTVQCGIGVFGQDVSARYLYPGIQADQEAVAAFYAAAGETDMAFENFASRSALYNRLYNVTFTYGGLMVSIAILLIAITCVTTVISTHIALRDKEFSLLCGLGWTKNMLGRYFFREVAAYFTVSAVASVGLVIALGNALDAASFAPKGLDMVWFSWMGSAILALCFVSSFAVVFFKGRKLIVNGISSEHLIQGD